ncbi:MAG: hypothetical protein EZS28_019205 [Streblomastix strix]|uniref:Uncharacterized protein n=1 Tax=Streblomastix strix TaxID=222440 RepID=A0A5J4VRP1_9EUKA|nr:MAG: hypothetical protein EZS28_019205 [Streblomastix strix]
MLSLVFVLISFLFGARNEGPLTFSHDKVFIYKDKLVVDAAYPDKVDITTRPILSAVTDKDADSFQFISDEALSALKGFTPLGFDSAKCRIIKDYTSSGQRALVSLAAYVYNNSIDIHPSITYAMEALPKDSLKKTMTNFVIYEDKGETQRRCDPAQSYLDASFELNGVVDGDCVRYDIDYCNLILYY